MIFLRRLAEWISYFRERSQMMDIFDEKHMCTMRDSINWGRIRSREQQRKVYLVVLGETHLSCRGHPLFKWNPHETKGKDQCLIRGSRGNISLHIRVLFTRALCFHVFRRHDRLERTSYKVENSCIHQTIGRNRQERENSDRSPLMLPFRIHVMTFFSGRVFCCLETLSASVVTLISRMTGSMVFQDEIRRWTSWQVTRFVEALFLEVILTTTVQWIVALF